MSASLVGSEMCIRDRGVSAESAATAAPPAAPSPAAGPGPAAGEGAAGGACLLYTSDAADDM
eukprot:12411785-Alexandrium_andersonii.AAC.1